jgi:hypothetical protein
MTSSQSRLAVLAALLAGAGTASAQVEAPLFSGGGAVLADGTILVLGQFAIGPADSATDAINQGAVPCWVVQRDCPGDLNGSGNVDLHDLATLLANFGTTSGAAPEEGDTDGDGDIDLADLAMLLAAFGTSCP